MKYNLKTRLSLTIALVSLLTVALISFLSNLLIENQFKSYITRQQKTATEEIADALGQQYNAQTGRWDVDYIHTIGMNALYDGYILKVYDLQNKTIWDAEECDLNGCNQMMDEVTQRMLKKYPRLNGQFTSKDLTITTDSKTVGKASIRYYGPYFLSENDFAFLNSLNAVLIGAGILSLAFSVLVGIYMARRLSKPILRTIKAAKQISQGDYATRIDEKSNTKEVSELVVSINQLADSLGKQEGLRKQLTTDVAHELRTPLTNLQTHLEAMVEGLWQPTPERLISCHNEAVRLSKLVQDLESLARVDGTGLKLEKILVDLKKLVKTVLRSFETDLRGKGIHVSVEGGCSIVYIDENRISQVVVNLLSNAIKYSPEGGRIEISLSETDAAVILRVQDNGMGIPQEELPFIFERFYRADKSRNRSTGGTGIGLAIVKSIVTAHGGTVEVSSKINEGSCFVVTLPK